MTAADDMALLQRWRDGDRDAGNELFERYFDRVYAFFESKVGHEAEELTQRTFEGCIESRDRFRGDSTFRGFLFGIARIQFLRHLQTKATRRPVRSTEDSLLDLGLSVVQGLAQEDHRRILVAALQEIPIDFQVVLELHYWQELSTKEIAEALDVAPGTVKSRLSRARQMLRERIETMDLCVELRDETLRQIEGMDAP